MKRKKARQTPIMLLWSRAEQRRFSDAVEHLVSAVHDLAELIKQLQATATALASSRYRRSEAARRANATRRAPAEDAATQEGLNGPPFDPPYTTDPPAA